MVNEWIRRVFLVLSSYERSYSYRLNATVSGPVAALLPVFSLWSLQAFSAFSSAPHRPIAALCSDQTRHLELREETGVG